MYMCVVFALYIFSLRSPFKRISSCIFIFVLRYEVDGLHLLIRRFEGEFFNIMKCQKFSLNQTPFKKSV